MSIAACEQSERLAAVGFDYDAQEKVLLQACPLCGSQACGPIYDRDRYGFKIRLDLCVSCGFVFLNDRMTKVGYAEFYKHWYRPLVGAFSCEEVTAESIQDSQRSYAAAVCDFAGEYLSKWYRRRVLDVGGSTGIFCDELAKRWGYHSAVIDPSPDELAIAKSKGHEGILGTVDDYAGRVFDVISLLQTVDHLLDPVETLTKIKPWLSPQGILLIDFIDFRLLYKDLGIETSVKIDHPLYFTAYTAECLLARVGFESIVRGRSIDRRHMIFACRPVPENPQAMPIRESVEQAIRELEAFK